jgi:hypothetical protein
VRHEDVDAPDAGFTVVVGAVVVVEIEPGLEGVEEGVVTGGVEVWNMFSRPEQSTELEASTHV